MCDCDCDGEGWKGRKASGEVGREGGAFHRGWDRPLCVLIGNSLRGLGGFSGAL